MFPLVLIESVLAFLGLGMVAAGVPIDSAMTVSLGCFMVAGAGLVHLWACFAHRQDYWSFCDIHAAALLISYFGGAAVTLWLSKGGVIAFWSAPSLGDMLIASVYIVLFCAVLRLLGRFECQFWSPVWRAETENDHWPSWTVALLIGLGAAQFYMLLTGLVTFKGTGTLDGVRLPYLPSLVVSLSWPLAGVCGWILGRAHLRRHRPLLFSALALVPLQLLFNLGYGRRVLLFQSMIFVASFLWARGRGFTLRQMVLLGTAGLPVMYLLWMLFLALRVDSYGDFADQGQRRDLFDRLSTTSELMAGSWSNLQESQAVDVVNRVFVIGYLTDLVHGTERAVGFMGKKFVNDVVSGIPRFMLPSKSEILAELDANETSVTIRFGQPVTDRSEIIVTASYADFLWFGAVFYPPLVMLLGIFLAWVSVATGSGLFRVYVMSYTLLTALTVGTYFLTNSLNMVRTLVILRPVFFLAGGAEAKNRAAMVLTRQRPLL